MLVLSRKLNETIVIAGNIRVTVVGLRGNQVRLGIEAPDSIAIFRKELFDRTHIEDQSDKLTGIGVSQN
jgi:carbon storage regulator